MIKSQYINNEVDEIMEKNILNRSIYIDRVDLIQKIINNLFQLHPILNLKKHPIINSLFLIHVIFIFNIASIYGINAIFILIIRNRIIITRIFIQMMLIL